MGTLLLANSLIQLDLFFVYFLFLLCSSLLPLVPQSVVACLEGVASGDGGASGSSLVVVTEAEAELQREVEELKLRLHMAAEHYKEKYRECQRLRRQVAKLSEAQGVRGQCSDAHTYKHTFSWHTGYTSLHHTHSVR